MANPSEIKQAIKEAFDEEIKPLYVEREQHYQDHLFITELRGFLDNIKNTTIKVTIRAIITLVIGACIAGFIWSKGYLHK